MSLSKLLGSIFGTPSNDDESSGSEYLPDAFDCDSEADLNFSLSSSRSDSDLSLLGPIDEEDIQAALNAGPITPQPPEESNQKARMERKRETDPIVRHPHLKRKRKSLGSRAYKPTIRIYPDRGIKRRRSSHHDTPKRRSSKASRASIIPINSTDTEDNLSKVHASPSELLPTKGSAQANLKWLDDNIPDADFKDGLTNNDEEAGEWQQMDEGYASPDKTASLIRGPPSKRKSIASFHASPVSLKGESIGETDPPKTVRLADVNLNIGHGKKGVKRIVLKPGETIFITVE